MTDAMEAAALALEKLRFKYARKPQVGSLNGAHKVITAWLEADDEARARRLYDDLAEFFNDPYSWDDCPDGRKEYFKRIIKDMAKKRYVWTLGRGSQ